MNNSPDTGGFPLTTRKSVVPSYEPKVSLELPIPEELIPGNLITDMESAAQPPDLNNLLASRPIPEIFPALIGLRLSVTEARAKRTQKRLEELVEQQKVMHFIGKSVLLRNKSYFVGVPQGTDRPHRLEEKGPGERLFSINKRRLRVADAVKSKESAFPDIVGKKQTLNPLRKDKSQKAKLFFDQYSKGPDGRAKRSLGERRAMGVAARKYRNDRRMLSFYDKAFKHVETKPSRDAKGLPEKRDRLIVKAKALSNAKEAGAQQRVAKRAARQANRQRP